MTQLLGLCMYLAVRQTEPESASKDRARLVRLAGHHYGLEHLDAAVWLASLDRLVAVGDVLRTPRGYLPAPGSAERYRALGARLQRIGALAHAAY